MSKSGIHSLLTLVALSVILLTLVACGDSSTPAEVGTTEDSSPMSTPTSTPANRVQDTSPTSLDDYLAICAGITSGPTETGVTLEEFSAAWEEVTEQLDAANPPDEVADWHAAVLVYQRAVMEVLDDAPRRAEGVSEDEYIISVLFPVALQHQPDVTEAIKGMNPDLIARMIEAGCIDEDTLSIHLTPEEMKALGVSPGSTAGGKVITEFASISAGQKYTCGVGTDGALGCWGLNHFDQATPPDGVFVSVDTGWLHTCGVRTDGAVVCWGGGDDDPEPPDGEFTSVSASFDYTCAVRVDSTVVCWGVDDEGQSTPPAGEFVSVSAGHDHACGVTTDGTVACWGDEGFSNRTTPPVGQFASVSAWNLSCGVRTDRTVACWGGTIGEPEPPDGEFTSVSVGEDHTCGVRADSTVVCWGSDHLGQSTPPVGEFVAVSAGLYHTCGVMTDGSAVCWGTDNDGQASPPGAP